MACGILRAAGTNYHRLGFKQQECVLSGLGGRNLKSQCSWGCASSGGSRGPPPPPVLFPDLGAPGIPRVLVAKFQLPPSRPPCASLFSPFPSLIRTLVLIFRVLPTPGQSSLETIFLLTCVKIRSPSEVAGGHVFYWGHD